MSNPVHQKESSTEIMEKINAYNNLYDPVRFITLTMLTCLILQRFALPIAGLKISVSTPIVMSIAAWEVYTGRLAINRYRLALFLLLFSTALLSIIFQANLPVNIANRTSVPSLLYWLFITSFACLTFRIPMDEQKFFQLVNGCFFLIALAGVLQFIIQFVGISIFAFSDFLPSSILIEEQFALKNLVNGTSFFRSNGFFLVEASVFSQLMAVGLIIEILYMRRTSYLITFMSALLVSVSGTGWLVLSVFIIEISIFSGRKGAIAATGLVLVIGGVFASALLIFPNVGEAFLNRFTEFSLQGTSGYERFVTPFMVLRRVMDYAPHIWMTGIGPGASEDLVLPFVYVMNTPVKIIIEYGAFGLASYILLFLVASRTRRQLALVIPLLFLVLIAGGYQAFTPVLFPVYLIITVSLLKKQS